MKIPKKIQIAGKTYDVIFDKKIAHQEKISGRIYYEELKIILDNHLPMNKQSIDESFLHECIHGIDNALRIGLSEDQTCQLSELLYQVFKQIEDKK